MQNSSPVVTPVGAVNEPGTKSVRIVHISDTHGRHDLLLPDIPTGDILVHSGDFGCYAFSKLFRPSHHFYQEIAAINDFFSKVPHKQAIFVAGNHELHFPNKTTDEVQSLLTNCHYLCDSSVIMEGIKFYGSPWNGKRFSSLARAFSVTYGKTLGRHWEMMPNDVDVVVTHLPVHGILDLSTDRSLLKTHSACTTCGQVHPRWCHWGCKYLRSTLIDRVRPKLHLFGHCHERNNVITEKGIVFSNAAMKLIPQANIFDFYIPVTNGKTQDELR